MKQISSFIIAVYIKIIWKTSGFWPLVGFFGLINTSNRALCAPPPPPPDHRSYAASYSSRKINKNYFQKQNASLTALPDRQGRISFNWATLHPIRDTLHPNELRCTLLIFAAPY